MKVTFVKVRKPVLRGYSRLPGAIERDGELPGTHINFSKVRDSNGWDGIFTKPGRNGMLAKKD